MVLKVDVCNKTNICPPYKAIIVPPLEKQVFVYKKQWYMKN